MLRWVKEQLRRGAGQKRTALVSINLTHDEQELKKRIVLSERRGKVLIITMNRPERRNALGKVMRQGLRDAFDEFDADPKLNLQFAAKDARDFAAALQLGAKRLFGVDKVHLTLLDKAGIHADKFGDSQGRVDELLAV